MYNLDENLHLKCFLCDTGIWWALKAGMCWSNGHTLITPRGSPLTSTCPFFLKTYSCWIWELHKPSAQKKTQTKTTELLARNGGLRWTVSVGSPSWAPICCSCYVRFPHLVHSTSNGLPTLWAADEWPWESRFSHWKFSSVFLLSAVFEQNVTYAV